MPSTFDTVAKIISETCDIPQETIKPESHAINDLGIDSLDFLDIAFAIDKAFVEKKLRRFNDAFDRVGDAALRAQLDEAAGKVLVEMRAGRYASANKILNDALAAIERAR